MDPNRPESFNHKIEELPNGHSYHFVDQEPQGYDKLFVPTLLCVHGFPDLWYGWRYQIGPWVSRGYRVIVPDMLGYGGSSKPRDAENYSTKRLCSDLVDLLDRLEIRKVVLIGHDWGAFIASRFALWHPDRLLGLVILSVPYRPPSLSRNVKSLEAIVQNAPNLRYQLYFADPRSDTEIINDLRKFLTLVFTYNSNVNFFSSNGEKNWNQPITKHTMVLKDKELDYYYLQLSQDMHGPLNYYRTVKFRYEEEIAANLDAKLPGNLPVLFIWGTGDTTITTSLIDKARDFIRLYDVVTLEGRGHWLMVEAKDEVTDRIANWLDGVTQRIAKL